MTMTPNLHEPSAEQLSSIARRLMEEAQAGGPAHAPIDVAPRTSLPTVLPMPAVPDAPRLPAHSPAHDLSGLREFLARTRGMSHLAHPSVLKTDGSGIQPRGFALPAAGFGPLDVEGIRHDFPILQERVNGKPLAWLDNAATTQKPRAVIDAVSHFYEHDNSNIHRGAHSLAARATDAYENARKTVAAFLGASTPDEILFVRGCTEGVNLVANSLASTLARGDEIVLPELEHHANIVPWQMVAERTGAVIRVAPIDDRGEVILEAYEALLGPRTRIVSMSHASNSLGTILPVHLMTAMAKARGATVLVDGAQSVSHFPVDVRTIGCDFYVFSGHKIFAPTGIGAVYATSEVQRTMQPWQGGGNMIRDVTFAHTTYADPPARFEAGTPSIGDAIGLAAALDYVTVLGRERIAAYEHELLEYATGRLSAIDGLRLVGTAREKVGVLSFVIPGRDPIDIGRRLDADGIAVRAGHHCAQPSLRHFGLESTVRPSLAFYNTRAEIDRLVTSIMAVTAGPARPPVGP